MHGAVADRRRAGANDQREVEPDALEIPPLLTSVIDELIEAEQRRTGEPAHVVRMRFRQEQLDAIAEWAAGKQGASHAGG